MLEHPASSGLMPYGNELGRTADHIPAVVKKEEAHHSNADRGSYRADGGDRHRGDRAKRAGQLSRNRVELRAKADHETAQTERPNDPVEGLAEAAWLLQDEHELADLLGQRGLDNRPDAGEHEDQHQVHEQDRKRPWQMATIQ